MTKTTLHYIQSLLSIYSNNITENITQQKVNFFPSTSILKTNPHFSAKVTPLAHNILILNKKS